MERSNNIPPLSSAFSALGDPVRLGITERLLRQGPSPAGDLQDVGNISAPAISRHLKVLRAAGLITQTIQGSRRIYAINPPAMERIEGWLKDHAAFWTASLDRLEAALSEDDEQ